jgi:CMP-2-keto-3-deoxyoctulosonic acid synthetase
MSEGNQLQDQIQSRPHERRQSPDHVGLYANSAQVTGSYFDIQVSFGEILEATEQALITEDRVTIKMSPQLAKRLLRILADNIRKYEEKFGEIPAMPD